MDNVIEFLTNILIMILASILILALSIISVMGVVEIFGGDKDIISKLSPNTKMIQFEECPEFCKQLENNVCVQKGRRCTLILE